MLALWRHTAGALLIFSALAAVVLAHVAADTPVGLDGGYGSAGSVRVLPPLPLISRKTKSIYRALGRQGRGRLHLWLATFDETAVDRAVEHGDAPMTEDEYLAECIEHVGDLLEASGKHDDITEEQMKEFCETAYAQETAEFEAKVSEVAGMDPKPQGPLAEGEPPLPRKRDVIGKPVPMKELEGVAHVPKVSPIEPELAEHATQESEEDEGLLDAFVGAAGVGGSSREVELANAHEASVLANAAHESGVMANAAHVPSTYAHRVPLHQFLRSSASRLRLLQVSFTLLIAVLLVE